jgi:hypothetical protein
MAIKTVKILAMVKMAFVRNHSLVIELGMVRDDALDSDKEFF